MRDPRGSVHVAAAAWLGRAERCPAALGRACRQISAAGACLAQPWPEGTLQPSKPSTLPPASALCSPAWVLQLRSQPRHPKARFHARGLPAKLGWRWRTGVTGLNCYSCPAETSLLMQQAAASQKAFMCPSASKICDLSPSS